MCLLQLSRSPQWTRILSISSRQFHSTLARRVLSTLHLDSKVTACRKDVHLVSLESSVCPDLASREHMVWISDARKASSSFGSNLISPRWMIPESELPKKRLVKEQTSLCVPGARNASKSKIVEACLRSNCCVARREVLQSLHPGGCNRSEAEMRCVCQAVAVCNWLWGLSF